MATGAVKTAAYARNQLAEDKNTVGFLKLEFTWSDILKLASVFVAGTREESRVCDATWSGEVPVSVVLALTLCAVTRRDPEAGAVGQDGRGHRDHPAALPQPPGEEPRPALHAQVSHRQPQPPSHHLHHSQTVVMANPKFEEELAE